MGRLKMPDDFVAKEFVSKVPVRSAEETLYDALKRKYPLYADNFCTRFKAATGEEFEWENVNLPNLDRFVQYLIASGLAENSINQYCHKIMALFNLYRSLHVNLPSEEELSSVLDTPTDESYDTYLDDDDIDVLYSHLEKLKTMHRNDRVRRKIEVLSHFLISADTGARSFDEKGLNWDNVSEGVDSNGNEIYILTYTTNKRGIKATIPLAKHSRVVGLIRDIMPLTESHRGCNRLIKVICRDAGLTRTIKRRRAGKDITEELCEAIHFHVGRKSFVTNSLKRGANITDVMQFVGHSNPKQTMKYNCSGPVFDSDFIKKQR